MRRATFYLGAVFVIVIGAAGYASATLTDQQGFSFEVLSKAMVPEGVDLRTDGATDAYTVRVTVEPGGTTGWHAHPDAARSVAAVTQGTMTLRIADGDSCQTKTLPTGAASEEPVGIAHEASNEGAVPLEFYFTFFGPTGTPILTEASAPSGCR